MSDSGSRKRPAPVVSVLMPAHNAAPYIRQAIRSILMQSMSDFELLVLENGSEDGTAEIAREFSDPRVKVLELGAIGFAAALQVGLEVAKAQWIARMDADDLSVANRLAKQLQAADRNPSVCAVGTNLATLSHSGHCIAVRRHVVEQPLTLESVLGVARSPRYSPDASMMFRRDRAVAIGGYDPDFKCADTTLWFRLFQDGIGVEIPDVLYLYRAVPSSLNSSHSDGLLARQRYFPETADAFRKVHPQSDRGDKRTAGYWWRMLLYDSIARDTAAASIAAREVLRHSADHRQHLACRFLPLPLLCHLLRRRNAGHYQHRPDLDDVVRATDRPVS